MQGTSVYSKKGGALDTSTLRAFHQESNGQLESLFLTMRALAEKPTTDSIIAVIESYIQMNRVISSISIIDKSYSSNLTEEDFTKCLRSVNPTLGFLSEIKNYEDSASSENAIRLRLEQYSRLRKSILDETNTWLKQKIAKSDAQSLVTLVESQDYKDIISSLNSKTDSLPSALVIVLCSLKSTLSGKDNITYENKEVFKSPVADYYIEQFENISKSEKGLISSQYANKLNNKNEVLDWMGQYMKVQLATVCKVKPQVSLDYSFLHNYSSDNLYNRDQTADEIASSVLGIFLTSVQYNFLNSNNEKSEQDISYVLQKLVLLQQNSALVQELTEADMHFLRRQRHDGYIRDVAKEVYKILCTLDAETVKSMAEGLSSQVIASFIKTLRNNATSKSGSEIYADFGMWVECLLYLVRKKSEASSDNGPLQLEKELSEFNDFRVLLNYSLDGIPSYKGDISFVNSDSTPYAIQTVRLYNSQRYAAPAFSDLRHMIYNFNMPLELFSDVLAMAYIDNKVYYKPEEMFRFDKAVKNIPIEQELFTAISEHDFAAVRAVMKYDREHGDLDLLNKSNSDNLTPLKAAVLTGNLNMVKMILSGMITKNKALANESRLVPLLKLQDVVKGGSLDRVSSVLENIVARSKAIDADIALPLQFAIDNNKHEIAKFFGEKLGLSDLDMQNKGLKDKAPSIASTIAIKKKDLLHKFRNSHASNIALMFSQFLCKVACLSMLLWMVSVVLNSPMFATIFAFATCVPIFITCMMHMMVSSIYCVTVVDSLATKLGYGRAGNRRTYNPEMSEAYIENIMPAVSKSSICRKDNSSGTNLNTM